jgi:exodeoxyribonuclease VII small subunit
MSRKTSDDGSGGKESQTYRAMLEQVETIITDISSPQLDLDLLVEKIESGYGLIKKMRSRLDETKGKVEKLRADFE